MFKHEYLREVTDILYVLKNAQGGPDWLVSRTVLITSTVLVTISNS